MHECVVQEQWLSFFFYDPFGPIIIQQVIQKIKLSLNQNNREKIIVICPKHGEWKTTHHSHAVNGHGCQKCGSHKRAPQIEAIITKFRSVHADRYDYSLVSWNEQGEHGWLSKVTIICSRHGQFRMTPAVHYFQKANCQKCSNEQKSLKQRKTLGIGRITELICI